MCQAVTLQLHDDLAQIFHNENYVLHSLHNWRFMQSYPVDEDNTPRHDTRKKYHLTNSPGKCRENNCWTVVSHAHSLSTYYERVWLGHKRPLCACSIDASGWNGRTEVWKLGRIADGKMEVHVECKDGMALSTTVGSIGRNANSDRPSWSFKEISWVKMAFVLIPIKLQPCSRYNPWTIPQSCAGLWAWPTRWGFSHLDWLNWVKPSENCWVARDKGHGEEAKKKLLHRSRYNCRSLLC